MNDRNAVEQLGPEHLTFVHDHVQIGRNDRRLRRDSSLHRMRRGAYVQADAEQNLSAEQRYDLRIHAVLGTRRSPIVISHQSAARLWSMPMIEGWPWHVHATIAPNSSRRSKNGVIVHRADLLEHDVVELHGALLTSVGRTVLDLARTVSFVNAVGVADFALRYGLVERDELNRLLDAVGSARGTVTARTAIDFASPFAESPGESFSRAVMHEWGFPAPELQHVFETTSGRRRVDFWWPEHGIAGEFDGRIKYSDSAEETYWQEKQRANELFDLGVPIVRWTWLDVAQRAPFVRRLEAAGLLRRRPRGYSARSGR